MSYYNKNNQGAPRPTIKRKYVKVIELIGESVYELEPGQRVVDSRIIHDVVEVRQPKVASHNWHTPNYKTVVVLECVEYENS